MTAPFLFPANVEAVLKRCIIVLKTVAKRSLNRGFIILHPIEEACGRLISKVSTSIEWGDLNLLLTVKSNDIYQIIYIFIAAF